MGNMDSECLVAFASLNQVALLKRALQQREICVEMLRTPRHLTTEGCGFSIRCRMDELPQVLDVCRTSNLKPGGVFENFGLLSANAPPMLTEDELEG